MTLTLTPAGPASAPQTKGVVGPVPNEGPMGGPVIAAAASISAALSIAASSGGSSPASQPVSVSASALAKCAKACKAEDVACMLNYAVQTGVCTGVVADKCAGDCSSPSKLSSVSAVHPADEGALGTALAKGVVLVVLEADSTSFERYRAGVFQGPCPGAHADHAMLLVVRNRT